MYSSTAIMLNDTESEIEEIYQRSLQLFNKLRSKYERHEANDIGGRAFVLVNAMHEDLLSPNQDQRNLLTDLLNTAYGRHDNSPIPHHKPTEIHDCLPIFYTLLDLDRAHLIHHFLQHEPPIKQLPVELDVLKTIFLESEADQYTQQPFERLAEDIYNQQWFWCAFQFDNSMSSKMNHHERRIPITARFKIEPARDGVHNADPKATLWVVEIPVECVGQDLKEELERNESAPNDEHENAPTKRKNYNVVIKQFTAHHKDRFIQERDIFRFIQGNKGIVQYFGWYKHCEKDTTTGEHRTYYNLVLERGTQDLYSAFQKENPPITYCEIQAFWSSLFDVAEALASIQIIVKDTLVTRYVWHGDIKPENILNIQGRFKLADPVSSIKEAPFVTQGIDIWSLGCVFSVAATYVVAGKEGVKQYRLLRQRSCSKLGLGMGDVFHDTENVLPEVTLWHKYLRTGIRAQDTFTSKLLDIVDTLMLITPGEARISGSDLTLKLAKISEEAESRHHDRQQPPNDILEFLDEEMGSTVEEHLPTLEEIPRTISQSGEDMFKEALLYRSLRSEGRPPVPRGTAGKQAIHVHREQHPHRGLYTSSSQQVGLRSSPRDLHQINTRFPFITSEPSPRDDPPVTFWEIEAQLEEHGTKSLIPGSKRFSRQVPVRGKSLKGKDDQLSKHFDSRDLIYLVDNASTMTNFWKHASYLLRVLVWRSLEYDKDGMELFFTNGASSLGLKPKKKQKVVDFTKKMDEAKPKPDEGVKTDMKASLEAILGSHMRQHRVDQVMKRELTVLVLTDGLWEANDDQDVEEYLVSFIKTNKAGWGWDDNAPGKQSRRRPISIQFIRFGHHPKAIARLRHLDDELKNRPELIDKEIPDMIDTENADGDVYKMFLGSFLEDMDNKLIQGGTTPDVQSALTPTASACLPDGQRIRVAENLEGIVHRESVIEAEKLHENGPFREGCVPEFTRC
ncbi:hypothetical protein N0V82_005163 [Gnomoniopsis sp. IMI 355080]|nr:hypothetical protein N0V82_005163 [Gnomoniopsis sp. IMI 355080]